MRKRLVFAFAGMVATATFADAQQGCENLKNLALPGVTITSSSSIAAGSFTLPSTGTRTANTVEVPAFCRVAGLIKPEVRFELWMPSQWNRKLMAVGNGGLAGTISFAAMINPLKMGYAASSTDTGHQGTGTNDGTWALRHYERIVDFADRGVHVMAQADKEILHAFYGSHPSRSYFSGCSQGGHAALIEAQRYPADFDGIIAGDPANNWTRHYVGGHLWAVLAMEGDGYIPPAKVPVIADAVNNACDALDGVKDGVLNDPRRCHFDPAALLCKGADSPACLTGAQVNAVKKLWAGVRNADGDQVYPGLLPGGEAGPGGWTNWITGQKQGTGGHSNLGLPFFKFMVFDDPNWDFHSFRWEATAGVDSDVDFTDAKLGTLFNATDPNLTAFKSRGGKLIQYHGFSDPDITPLNSIHYYESVAETMAHGGNHGYRDTREFYRLFMVPGMQHCQGGPGATSFSMVEPLEQWAEHGIPPEQVIASHMTNGAPSFTRPLCAYPYEAHWKGTGSADKAENFTCVLPARP